METKTKERWQNWNWPTPLNLFGVRRGEGWTWNKEHVWGQRRCVRCNKPSRCVLCWASKDRQKRTFPNLAPQLSVCLSYLLSRICYFSDSFWWISIIEVRGHQVAPDKTKQQRSRHYQYQYTQIYQYRYPHTTERTRINIYSIQNKVHLILLLLAYQSETERVFFPWSILENI